jgi:serine/threonine protein kinase
MLQTFSPEFEQHLYDWIRASLENGRNILSGGYQARTLLYDDGAVRLVIKATPSAGLRRFLLLAMLRHEYRVYQQLAGVEGIPRCYGLVRNRFLVLEYIDGISLRTATLQNPQSFYAGLLALIQRMHALGVAHLDLKKKDNILVGRNEQPVLIDFGIACLRKSGWHLLNRFIFAFGRRADLHAWVKHKYQRRYAEISAADLEFFQRNWLEKTVWALRHGLRRKLRARRRRLKARQQR